MPIREDARTWGKRHRLGLYVISAMLIMLAVLFGARALIIGVLSEEMTITVNSVSVKGDSTGPQRFLVFAKEGEFEVTDSLIWLDWRAASRFNALSGAGVGATCDVTAHGIRWGFMSWYPNLVRIHRCTPA